jgi:hypothetical protein
MVLPPCPDGHTFALQTGDIVTRSDSVCRCVVLLLLCSQSAVFQLPPLKPKPSRLVQARHQSKL